MCGNFNFSCPCDKSNERHLNRRGEASTLRLGVEPRPWQTREREPILGAVGTDPPAGGQGAEPPVKGQGAKPPEAESSVAFEAPEEEPNLTL